MHGLHVKIIIFWIYWVKWDISLELILPAFFFYFLILLETLKLHVWLALWCPTGQHYFRALRLSWEQLGKKRYSAKVLLMNNWRQDFSSFHKSIWLVAGPHTFNDIPIIKLFFLPLNVTKRQNFQIFN